MSAMGSLVRRHREAKDMSQEELARAVSRSKQWVSQVESGLIRLKGENLRMVAEALGVTVDSLESTASKSLLNLRTSENRGIPIINKAPAGPAWDYEAYGVSSRDGHSYLERMAGEESDDLFAVEVAGDSMAPGLCNGDVLVLWPVAQGVPPQSIDGRVVLASFSKDHGGGVSLARLQLTGKSDDYLGLQARLVKDNPKHKAREIWLTDLDRLAVATRVNGTCSVRPVVVGGLVVYMGGMRVSG